jgi:hypothetical protein
MQDFLFSDHENANYSGPLTLKFTAQGKSYINETALKCLISI